MSNWNFFRLRMNINGESPTPPTPSPPVLSCGLELADFNLDPITHKNFANFRSYTKTYFSRIAIGSEDYTFNDPNYEQQHYLYAGWYPTGSLVAPFEQLIYQFEHNQNINTEGITPNLSSMTVYTSSVNNTSSFRLPGNTMRQDGNGYIDTQPIFFQTIQVPHTGSKIHFGAISAIKPYVFQYDLDTDFDVTTLNTASRVYEELRQLTASGNKIKQTSYNGDGSQMYQITENNDGFNIPYNHWTILHVMDLSTPYDLNSYNSSNTSSYILENELSNLSGPYPNVDSNKVDVSTFNYYDETNSLWVSSMYYTNSETEKIIKFRINPNRSLSNEELLTTNDFPMAINYSNPKVYSDPTGNESDSSFFIRNTLLPYNETVNVNRTSSCLAPYSKESSDEPSTTTLDVEATSVGFPPSPVVLVSNESNSNQAVTYTWKYVSQTSDIPASVFYNGNAISTGFTTPTLNANLSTTSPIHYNDAFYIPFTFSGGNDAYIYLEFTLLTAAIDNVPASPNNKATVTKQINT